MVALLVGAVAHVFIARWAWRDVPLQTDAGIWAYMGARLLEGAQLYRDVWDSKPPGVFYTFAAVEWLFGTRNDHALLWLDAVVSLLVLAITYRLARRFAGRLPSSIAILLLSLTFCHRILPDWGSNTEKFVTLFEVLAAYLLLSAFEADRAKWRLPAAGFCCALAAMYKQTGILFLLAATLAIVVRRFRIDAPAPSRRRLCAELWLGAAVPWVFLSGWMLAGGILGEFAVAVIFHDFLRVTSVEREGARILTAEHWVSAGNTLKSASAVLLPALLGAFLWAGRLLRSARGVDGPAPQSSASMPYIRPIILLYWLLPVAAFLLAPHGHGHYLLQAFPFAAVTAAWMMEQIIDRRAGPSLRFATVAAVLFGVYCLGDHFHFTFASSHPAHDFYRAQRAMRLALVDAMKDSVRPDHSIQLWPPDYAVYYHTGRTMPLEWSSVHQIFKGKLTRLRPPMPELLERLADDPPDVFVDSIPIRVGFQSSEVADAEPVLLVRKGSEGLSLAEPPDDSHFTREGILLAPFKRWLRENYGGQRRLGSFTLYYRGEEWRDWQEVMLPVEERGLGSV